jgi:hypothetical protein
MNTTLNTALNTALMLNDLDMNKELDRAALAQVIGGYSVYSTSSWQYTSTGSRIYSSWKRNFWTGRHYKTWKQYRYAKRTQYGKEKAASGTIYA